MLWRTCAVAALVLSSGMAFLAQDRIIRLDGRVLAEGRPVDWVVEVRLDSGTSGTIDTAYTLAGEDFEFRNVPIDSNDTYYLVIEEPGFEPYREQVHLNRDPLGTGARYAGASRIIRLNRSRNTSNSDPRTGPDTVDLSQLLAEIPDEAREAYQDALDDLREGDRESAIKRLEHAVSLAPEYYEALNLLSTEYMRSQQFGPAAEILIRAVEMNPNDPIPITNLGTLHFEIGQTLEAGSSGEEAVNREVETAHKNAVSLFERALRLDSGSPRIHHYLASALYKTGNYERSEALLLEALARDASLVEARITLINVYLGLGKPAAAIEQIDWLLDSNADPERQATMEDLRRRLASTRDD